MLTLYSPFYVSEGNESHNNRTWSALTSWEKLVPRSHIILFTEDSRSCSWLRANGFDGIRCLLTCTHPQIPRQDIGCMTSTAVNIARTPFLCMINSDILMMPNFKEVFNRVFLEEEDLKEPFMVGRRTNLLQNVRTDFTSQGWPARVLQDARENGDMDGVCAIDYFVHTRTVWDYVTMPGFVAGVWRWDRYLLSEANRHDRITTVDATEAFTAVHLQTEEYLPHQARPYHDFNTQVLLMYQGLELNDEGASFCFPKKKNSCALSNSRMGTNKNKTLRTL